MDFYILTLPACFVLLLITSNPLAMQTTQEDSSFLLSLPTELIERIACHADDAFPKERPLPNLRSTCRQLYHQVSPEFAKRYLSEPFIIMSRYSLEALVSICEHPVFGPEVRKVRLQAFPQFVRQSESIRPFLRSVTSHLRYLPGLLQLNPRIHEDIKSIVKEDTQLRSSGEALELLTTAFNSLAEHKTSVVLVSETYHVPEDAKRQSPPIGYDINVMTPLCEMRRCAGIADPECLPALQYLLRAAGKSACNVKSVEIHHSDTYSPGPFLHLPLHFDEMRILQGLCSASITINGLYYGAATERNLHTFISQADNIMQLRLAPIVYLDDHRSYECKYIGRLLRPIYLPMLRSLILDGFLTSSQDLKGFLIKHNSTLKEVELKNITIDPWKQHVPLREFFAWIRDNLTLERVLIGEIYAVGVDQSMYQTLRLPWHLGEVDLKGAAAIQSGLSNLCNESKRMRKLFLYESRPRSTDAESPIFAAMAGLSEQDFVHEWCSDGVNSVQL